MNPSSNVMHMYAEERYAEKLSFQVLYDSSSRVFTFFKIERFGDCVMLLFSSSHEIYLTSAGMNISYSVEKHTNDSAKRESPERMKK